MLTATRILQVTFALAASVAFAFRQPAPATCLLSVATTLWLCGIGDEEDAEEDGDPAVTCNSVSEHWWNDDETA